MAVSDHVDRALQGTHFEFIKDDPLQLGTGDDVPETHGNNDLEGFDYKFDSDEDSSSSSDEEDESSTAERGSTYKAKAPKTRSRGSTRPYGAKAASAARSSSKSAARHPAPASVSS